MTLLYDYAGRALSNNKVKGLENLPTIYVGRFFMHICNRCKTEFKSYDALRRHAGRIHKIPSIDFYVDHILNGKWPVCKCGCNERVKWSHGKKGFVDYRQGHQSRVNNNWGHNKNAQTKSAKTRRKQFQLGERKVWNDGLTKDDDYRIKNYGKTISDTFSHERKIRYARIMKSNRLNGTVPTLTKSQHPQWKGGVSEINAMARSSTKLYKEWKYPILIRDKFQCVKCKSSELLHVHHDEETMSSIVKKHVLTDVDNMDFDLKREIADKIVEYHVKNNVSGVTLCVKCHGELHPSLNFE